MKSKKQSKPQTEPQAEPQTAEPQTEPQTTEPQTAEPQTAEPQAEPQTEPQTTEPQTTEPQTAEPQTQEPQTTEPQTAEPTNNDDDEEIKFEKIDLKNDVLKNHKSDTSNAGTTAAPNNSPTVGIDISMFITPRLAIVIYDRFYPRLLAYVYELITKKKVNKNINLDEQEIEALEPIVEEMMKGMQMKVPPIWAFLGMSTMFYVSKFSIQEGVNSAPTQKIVTGKKGRGRPRKENKA